jgi:hypothetical protein
MGERHIANVARHERAELAYVVDPDEVRVNALTARYGGVASTNCFR